MDSCPSPRTKPANEVMGVKESEIVHESKELKQSRKVRRSQHRKRKRSVEDCSSSPEFLTVEKVNVKKVKIPSNEEKESLLQSTLASQWATIMQNGLHEPIKNELITDYQPKEEYSVLKAPTLNPELAFIINENSLRSDDCKAQLQNQVSSALVGIGKIITTVLSCYDSGPLSPMSIEILFDIAMILGNVHHEISLQRRSTIVSAFDLEGITDCSKVKEMLFSTKLLNIIKTARTQNMEEKDDKSTIKLIESSAYGAKSSEERNATEKKKNSEELEKEKTMEGSEKKKKTEELEKEKNRAGPENEKSTEELEKEKTTEGPEKDKNTEELEKENTERPEKEKNTEELEKEKNTEELQKEKNNKEPGTEKKTEKEKNSEEPQTEQPTDELGNKKHTEESQKGINPKETVDGGKTSEKSNIQDSSQITISEKETLAKKTTDETAIQINQQTADVILLEVKNASLRIIEEMHVVREKTLEALQMNSTYLKREKKAAGRLGPEIPFPGFREAYKRKCLALGYCENAANTATSCIKDSTVKSYEKTIRLWWEFCRTNNYDVFHGSEQNVTQFLAENNNLISSGNVLNTWKSALGRFTTVDLSRSKIFMDYVKGFKFLKDENDKKVKGRK